LGKGRVVAMYRTIDYDREELERLLDQLITTEAVGEADR
jgi:hypothetical protein